jgi:hypothetical protein
VNKLVIATDKEGYARTSKGTSESMADPTPNQELVAQAFDELIEAHELLRAAEHLLEEYVAHNASPEVPEVFEDVEALLRYNAERERYELGHSLVMERRADCHANYAGAASRVEALLPEGTRLLHAYGKSSGAIPTGKRYLVYKERGLLADLLEADAVPQETATGEVSAVAYVVRVEEMASGSE